MGRVMPLKVLALLLVKVYCTDVLLSLRSVAWRMLGVILNKLTLPSAKAVMLRLSSATVRMVFFMIIILVVD